MSHVPVFYTVHNGDSHYNPKSVAMIATLGTFGKESLIFKSPEEAKQRFQGTSKHPIALLDYQEEVGWRWRKIPLSEAGELAKLSGAKTVFKIGEACVSKPRHQLSTARKMRDAAIREISDPTPSMEFKSKRRSKRHRSKVGRPHFLEKRRAERYHMH